MSASRRAVVVFFTFLLLVVAATTAATGAAAPVVSSGRSFQGNGGETLPPFRVASPSTLVWANNGGIFQIFPAGGQLHGSVNSQAPKGWTYLPPGTYTLQINAVGSWRVKIVAGIVRPSRLRGGLVGYSGNGGMELPPFRLSRGEKIYWTANGGIFQIFSGSYTGANVNSQASKGSTYVSAGTQRLQINTTGAWRIGWRP